MASFQEDKSRLLWIDWMKTTGMYFIILGHFFTIGHKYIYVFSVPLFFIISGFLCKKETSAKLFWEKTWYNLILPIIIIYVINTSFTIFVAMLNGSKISLNDIGRFIIYPIIGAQRYLGSCWFVYTLLILKIFNQFVTSKRVHFVTVLFFLYIAYIYNHIEESTCYPFLESPNAIINVFTAFPFFVIGQSLQPFKMKLDNIGNWTKALTLLFGILCVFLCGKYNEEVWMYKCGYGDNFFLFIIGGIAGSIAVFIFSKQLPYCSCAITISKGTLLILGFHGQIISYLHIHLSISPYIDYVLSFFILILFVPLIRIAENYFPVVLGKYRIKQSVEEK